jgi:hypothetical protein
MNIEMSCRRPALRDTHCDTQWRCRWCTFNDLQTKNGKSRQFPTLRPTRTAFLSRFLSVFPEFDRFEILALRLDLLTVDRVDEARGGLRLPMAKHRLDRREWSLA